MTQGAAASSFTKPGNGQVASPPLPCLQTSQVGSGQLAQACSGVEDEQDVKEEEVELSDRGILRIKWGAIRVCARPIWELSGRRKGVRMLLLGDMCVSAPPNAHRFCPPQVLGNTSLRSQELVSGGAVSRMI